MPRTILIYLFGDLGDTLLTVPAIRAVRGRYPAARIVLVSKAVGREIVQPLGIVDDVIVVDKHVLDRVGSLRHPRAWQEGFRLIRRLRREVAACRAALKHLGMEIEIDGNEVILIDEQKPKRTRIMTVQIEEEVKNGSLKDD